MTGFIHDLTGELWVETKKRYVNLCVNVHGDALSVELRQGPVEGCVSFLSPKLGRWLDRDVLPAAAAKIAAARSESSYDSWSIGLALFTFSPAGRGKGVEKTEDADRMTRDICRSMPAMRRCWMKRDESCAKGVLGQCFGNHFSDAKDRLVLIELGELSLRTWWKIERKRREVLEEWAELAESGDDLTRAGYKKKLNDDTEIAKAILERLPDKLGITQWERVRLYIDVFGAIEVLIPDLIDLGRIGPRIDGEQDTRVLIEQCLDALPEEEAEALRREYIHGIPRGMKSNDFTKTYGIARPTHNKHVRSGLVKLGDCLGHQSGEG